MGVDGKTARCYAAGAEGLASEAGVEALTEDHLTGAVGGRSIRRVRSDKAPPRICWRPGSVSHRLVRRR